MTTTETVLFVWLAFQSGILIFLCFERDRMNAKINDINRRLGAVLERLQ